MKRLRLFCVLAAALFPLLTYSHSPSWFLGGTKEGWNSKELAKFYFHHSEMQRQWSWELLGQYPFQGHETILDFGCGDGKITAEISRLAHLGSVYGTDISADMIEFAHKKFPPYAYPNLIFKQSHSLTFADWKSPQPFDLICSFCVFHLVPNPLEILKNLHRHLKPQGTLMLIVPAGKNPLFFQAAEELFAQYQLPIPWKNLQAPSALTLRTLEGCQILLKEAGYDIESLKMVDTDNAFVDSEELIAWMIGTTTANWNVPLELSLDFFTALVKRLEELDPHFKDEEGRIHFKLSRIHVLAHPVQDQTTDPFIPPIL